MSEHQLVVLVEDLGWALVHFVWQGGLIALVLAAVLGLTRARPSSERYVIRCAALVLMAVAPIVTFLVIRGVISTPVHGQTPAIARNSAAGMHEWLANMSISSRLATGDMLTWIVLLWSLGATICSLRLVGGYVQILRWRRRAAGVDLTPRWQRHFDRLASELGVRVHARVVECASVVAPTVIGWAKPVVLLPARIFTGLTEEQIEALIAHELAHVSRHDYLVNILQSTLEAVLFYHPAVWWVSRGIRLEREYCCDDLAVGVTKDGLSVARALASVGSWRWIESRHGVSASGGSLRRRIQRLVGVEPAPRRTSARSSRVLALLAVLGSLGASAFGLAAFADSAQGSPCACHTTQAVGMQPSRSAQPRVDDDAGEHLEDRFDLEQLRASVDEIRAELDALDERILQEVGDRDHGRIARRGVQAERDRGTRELSALSGIRPKLEPFYDPESKYLYISPELNGVLAAPSPELLSRLRDVALGQALRNSAADAPPADEGGERVRAISRNDRAGRALLWMVRDAYRGGHLAGIHIREGSDEPEIIPDLLQVKELREGVAEALGLDPEHANGRNGEWERASS